ncbi:MAG: Tol biopolymer transport system component [Chlamydiales bacterium]|jgi:Tol biopolymer transport system component
MLQSLNKKFVIFLAMICSFSQYSYAEVDQNLNWFTISTPHFNIHYHEEEESKAQKLAVIAEEAHTYLSQELEWTPSRRTEVVLNDNYDLTNGYANPIPYNKIYLFDFPETTAANGLMSQGNTLKYLFIHEYTHILQMDKASKNPLTFRNIFGPTETFFLFSFKPNIALPLWFIEGLAVYNESHFEKGVGRGQGSHYPMQMRTELKRGLKGLDEINMDRGITWPFSSRYLYGYYFIKFIADEYGKETLVRLIDRHGSNLIPFRVNDTFVHVIGKDCETLWNEYRIYLSNMFQPEIDDIRSKGIVEGSALTTSGGRGGMLRSTPDGSIYYSEDNLIDSQSLFRLSPNGEKTKLFSTTNPFTLRFSIHPERGIVFNKLDRIDRTRIYADLYLMDMDGKNVRQLTEGKRIYSAAFDRSGTSIIATQYYQGNWRLVRLALTGEIKEVLWSGGYEELLSTIDCSPIQDKIITAVKSPKKGWQLAEFDLESKEWTYLTKGYLVGEPQYSQSGRDVVFSSDSEGVYNIKLMDLETKEISVLSNVLGGAFAPCLNNTSEMVYYFQYEGNGYNLYRSPNKSLGIDTFENPFISHLVDVNESDIKDLDLSKIDSMPSKAYSPFDSLSPKWWFPISLSGLTTSGRDALGLHSYRTEINLLPHPEAVVIYSYANTYVLGIKNNQETNETQFFGRIVYPLNYSLENRLYSVSTVMNSSENGLSFAEAVAFNNTFTARGGFSPQQGRSVVGVVDYNTKIHGSSFVLSWDEYLPITDTNILILSFARGLSTDSLYNIGGSYESDPAVDSFSKMYKLRGYSEGAQRGKHLQYVSAEWRFPIAKMERGLLSVPVGVQQIYGDVFVENGSAWNSGVFPKDSLSSVGAEVHVDATLFHKFPLKISIGYGKGLSFDSEETLITIGTKF